MTKILLKHITLWLISLGGIFGVYYFTAGFFPLPAVMLIILLPVMTWVMNFKTRKNITLSVRMPATTAKNKAHEVEIVMENESFFPVFSSYVEVTVKNQLTGEVSGTFLPISVSPHGTSSAKMEISSDKCGYINVKTGRVYLCDIFGMIPLRTDAYGEKNMSVMPDTFDMNVSLAVSYTSRMDEDTYSPDKSGQDYSETFQIREYVPGDSIKAIHYKLSEKLDKLYVKEGSLPVTKSVLVFWDKNAMECTPEDMDATAEVATSLCQALADSGHMFTLGWTDGEEFAFEEINHTDELFRAVGQMLKSGCLPGISGAERYSDEYGMVSFGKVIYIAGRVPEEIGKFAGENVTAVICPSVQAEDSVRTLSFTHGNYLTEMMNVEL